MKFFDPTRLTPVSRLLWNVTAERNRLLSRNRQLELDLAVERQRAGDMLFAATAPCTQCEHHEAEMLDVLEERDQWKAAAQFLERISLSGGAK